MNRTDSWRTWYLENRYLEYLPEHELADRAGKLANVLVELTPEGKIGLPPPSAESERWFRKLTEVYFEQGIRGLPSRPREIDLLQLPGLHRPLARRAIAARENLELPSDPYLVRYSKREHLVKLWDQGLMRISPASGYSNGSLNIATRDDELKFSKLVHPESVSIRDSSGSPITPLGYVKLTQQLPCDYYVLCLSKSWDFRLFDDFEADACLLITNPEVFAGRVSTALRRALGDGYGDNDNLLALQRDVEYYDPLDEHRSAFDDPITIFLTKSFEYAYQREFRIVWVFRELRRELEPIEIDVGHVRDVARFVELPQL